VRLDRRARRRLRHPQPDLWPVRLLICAHLRAATSPLAAGLPL
jgi:hypothetical protein